MTLKDMLIAALVCILWASNFIAIKVGVTDFPPIWLMTLRFAFVGAVLLPWTVKVKRHQIPHLLGLTLTLGVGYFALLAVGASMISAGLTTLIMQLNPPMAALIAGWALKEKLRPVIFVGMGLAFVGVAIVVGLPQHAQSLEGTFLVGIAAVLWAGSSSQIRLLKGIHPFTLNGFISLASFPILFLLGVGLEPSFLHHFEMPKWGGIAALLYMSLVSTIFCYSVWIKLLERNPVSKVAPFGLLQPPVAVLCAFFVLGEPIHLSLLIGGTLCVTGVALVVIRR